MSRLIDADKFLDFIKSELKQDRTDEKHLENIICVLENLPTAFDVEKVVEQLEEHVDEYEKMACECIDDEEEIVDILEFRAMGVRDAIEIVKAGGIDDNN